MRRLAALGCVGAVATAAVLQRPWHGLHAWGEGHLAAALPWVVAVCFVYLAVVYGSYVVLLAYSVVERSLRANDRRYDDVRTLSASSFTLPVAVVVAVYNEAPVVVASVSSVLAQDYPEHEVIVVDDGSTDATFDVLADAFGLEPEAMYPRLVFGTMPVLGTYRSRSDGRLIVVRKQNGGKADALNCGINHVHYPYVLGVDGDTVYRPDALLKGMRLVVRDPERVIGVTSHVAISVEPEASLEQVDGARRVDADLFSNFQHLDYLRSFMNNRLAWSRLGFMLCAVGAFHIWRRDVLEEVGGFSRSFTCEDIELTFRIHERFRRSGREYEILSLPDTIATTEGPNTLRSLVKQRARWQRVIAETVWHYRRMLFNPRYGSVGLLGVPFYLVTEVLAPAFEALAVVATLVAAWLGVLDWADLALALVAMSGLTATFSAIAVLLEDRTSRSYRLRDLVRLQLVSALDLFLYRPVLMWARLRGTIDFLRGRRDWDKFERNRRRGTAAAAAR